jgi:hypothetical protein
VNTKVALENDLSGHVGLNLRCPSVMFAHKSDRDAGSVREGQEAKEERATIYIAPVRQKTSISKIAEENWG